MIWVLKPVQVGKPPAAQTVPPGTPKQLFRNGSEQEPCHMLLFINSLGQGTKVAVSIGGVFNHLGHFLLLLLHCGWVFCLFVEAAS